jgi:hypothetical protein
MSPKDKKEKKVRAAEKKSREAYLPPRVTFTEITVNEALMGICKGGLGAGPYGPGCGGCQGGGS